MCFFIHNTIAHFIDYSVNIIFICTETPESAFDSLY